MCLFTFAQCGISRSICVHLPRCVLKWRSRCFSSLLFPSYLLEGRCNDWGPSNHFDHDVSLEMEITYSRIAWRRSLFSYPRRWFTNLALPTFRLLEHEREREKNNLSYLSHSYLEILFLKDETNFDLYSHIPASIPFSKVKHTTPQQNNQVLHHLVLPCVLPLL